MLRRDLLFSIRKFFKQKNTTTKITITAHDAIASAFWYELKHLISVTPSDYEQLYVKPLQILLDQLTHTAAVKNISEQIKSILILLIAVLKIRRAYMLPVGTDAETCYQQQDAWTYALFTATLFRKFVKSDSDPLSQVTQWLPAAAVNWLKQYPDLFNNWLECLSGKAVNNSLTQIIYQAEDALVTKTALAVNTQSVAADKNIDSNSMPSTKAIEQNETDQSSTVVPIQAEPTFSLADTFIAWLKRSIARRQLAINTQDALIHRVEHGVLLKIPDIYQQFVTVNNSVKAVLKDKNAQETIELLTQDKRFIANTNTGFIHRYYWNEWTDRQLINGLLLASTALFTPDNLPPCNEQLHAEAIL
jgi:hypothetical protein